MSTLKEVQKSIGAQIAQDYGDRSWNDITQMMFFGLAEEAGEVAGLRKRELRGFEKDKQRTNIEEYIGELGDVLWYLTGCCISLGITLDEIWDYNCKKLQERYPHEDHQA